MDGSYLVGALPGRQQLKYEAWTVNARRGFGIVSRRWNLRMKGCLFRYLPTVKGSNMAPSRPFRYRRCAREPNYEFTVLARLTLLGRRWRLKEALTSRLYAGIGGGSPCRSNIQLGRGLSASSSGQR